jgi:hypothetical protein
MSIILKKRTIVKVNKDVEKLNPHTLLVAVPQKVKQLPYDPVLTHTHTHTHTPKRIGNTCACKNFAHTYAK